MDIQINHLDSYQAPPSCLDRASYAHGSVSCSYSQVPVIRVFGKTANGTNVLVHVHNVFPYLYIEYTDKLENVHDFMDQLYRASNHAMSMAYRRDPESTPSFVASMVLCKGVPFYGYHVGWRPFLKIYLLNPSYLLKYADLLRTGKVLGVPMQTYESHLPHSLQFLADFNLYGCGWLKVSDQAWFRQPLPPGFRVDVSRVLDYDKFVPDFPRSSHCALEMDITADMIVNRLEIHPTDPHSDFSERSTVYDSAFKNLASMQELWEDDFRRRQSMGKGPHMPPPDMARAPPSDNSLWSTYDRLKRVLDSRVSQSQRDFDSAHPGVPLSFMSAHTRDRNVEVLPNTFQTVDHMLRPAAPEPIINLTLSQQALRDLEALKDDLTDDLDSDDDDDDDDDDGDDGKFDVTLPTSLPGSSQSLKSSQSVPLKRSCDESTATPAKKTASKPMVYSSQEFERSVRTSQSNLMLTSQANTSLASSQGKTVATKIRAKFHVDGVLLALKVQPPSRAAVEASVVPKVVYPTPFFSNPADVPDRPMLHAGVEFRLKGSTMPFLDKFYTDLGQLDSSLRSGATVRPLKLEYAPKPPSLVDVATYFGDGDKDKIARRNRLKQFRAQFLQSQIVGASQNVSIGHTTSTQSSKDVMPSFVRQQNNASPSAPEMSVFSLEVHVNCRPGKLADPKEDSITAVFWCMQGDGHAPISGSVVLDPDKTFRLPVLSCELQLDLVETEQALLNQVRHIVRTHDPDILTGYEVDNLSWGYLTARAHIYGRDYVDELSRIIQLTGSGDGVNKWALRHTSGVKVTGRHTFNLWRLLRKEVALLQYTLENVMYSLFQERIPRYASDDLTAWFRAKPGNSQSRTLEVLFKYYLDRVGFNLRIINHQELVSRYSTQARIIGIDFYSVYFRGSQFNVESLLARMTRKENYVMVSPSRKHVGEQNALEHIPLVMEPQSQFYTSPVLVLDFQSLYPSLMIAYNYCYSTCLGRVVQWAGSTGTAGTNKLGVLPDLDLPPGLLALLKDDINIAPNGLVFVKPAIRRSLLAKILAEVLETRVMVKDAAKDFRDDERYQRLMNHRQLALKLFANVTYGYTSATYSGRMPCAEIADSIVMSGRETLERAIDTIRQNSSRWGNAKLVYGDTDSLFVHLPGASRDQAFDLGQEIADTITRQNPAPVKLKFEKVYTKSILLTKKRYVGYMYERRDQKTPVFDAKGIETVRRDGTPAEQKIERACLELLFDSADLSKVKTYLQDQFAKIIVGKVSIQDFCFAREVKLGTYKEGGTLPAGAAVSTKKMASDSRAEPQYKERVPYVVVTGPPKSRLVDRCVAPEQLLDNPGLRLDAEYYITKNIIPPLERLFNILGANVRSWYDQMPKIQRTEGWDGVRTYLKSSACAVCGNSRELSVNGQCSECNREPDASALALQLHRRHIEQTALDLDTICRECCGCEGLVLDRAELARPWSRCVSGDCPVYYSKRKALARLV